jgi:hypothetical protein
MSTLPQTTLSLAASVLTTSLKDCNSLSQLCQVARDYKPHLNALHDCVICLVCAKLDLAIMDDNVLHQEAIRIYFVSLRNWLNRAFGSIGRDARGCANILQAGAKLRIDTSVSLYKDLCDVAILFANKLDPQGMSNSIWAIATLGVDFSGLALVPVLIKRCISLSAELDAHCIANCLWSVATLGVKITGEDVVHFLFTRCLEIAKCLTAQGVSNVLWSMAKLEMSNRDLIPILYDMCIKIASDLTPQGISNILWAMSSLDEEFVRDDTLSVLMDACLEHMMILSANDISFLFRYLAILRVSESKFVQQLSTVCIIKAKELSALNASTCLWAVATLGCEITGHEVIPILINVCLEKVQYFNDQSLVGSFWALACLEQNKHEQLSTLLQLSISNRFSFMDSVEHANQCLQAHYVGLTLNEDAVTYFQTILYKNTSKNKKKTTESQLALASFLKRLGCSPRLEVPLFNGIVTVDIAIDLSDMRSLSLRTATEMKVAVEFDGPWHFMRKGIGSADIVGPIDVRTRLRNSLIEKSGQFDALLVIPYYEWDEVFKYSTKRANDKSEKLSEFFLTKGYLKKKIQNCLKVFK